MLDLDATSTVATVDGAGVRPAIRSGADAGEDRRSLAGLAASWR
jgi:hypothetical protein